MNYSNLYTKIVQKFVGLKRTDVKEMYGYAETHHIHPRCLGGTDDESNLVHLSAKAHFILHYLLVKIHPNSSELWYAFYSMRNGFNQNPERRGQYFVTPRIYELIKSNIARLGRSEETRRKISETLTGKKRGPHSEVHRRNQSISMTGVKKTMSKDAIEARRLNAKKVPKWSEEKKNELSIFIKSRLSQRTPEQKKLQVERRKATIAQKKGPVRPLLYN